MISNSLYHMILVNLMWPQDCFHPTSKFSQRPISRNGSRPLPWGRGDDWTTVRHWTNNGLVGLVNRKLLFLPSNMVVSCKFSHHPIR